MIDTTTSASSLLWPLALGLPLLSFAAGYLLRFFQRRSAKDSPVDPAQAMAQLDRLTRLETENSLLKSQCESARQTEDLLRMELNDTAMSNARLEALLQERQQREQDDRQERQERENQERQQRQETADRQTTEQFRQQQEQAALQKAQFEALSQQTLKALRDDLEAKAERDYKLRQEAMEERLGHLLKPLREVLDENEKRVKEVEKQHLEGTTALKTQIGLLVTQTQNMAQAERSLVEALKNSKGRGDWGELELIRLLEHSGLMEGVHYDAQRQENGLRPDITLRLPNQRVLYIDAKTIFVNLERLMMADEDSEESLAERKKHAAALEKEVLSLSLKSYESQTSDSIDFVVLYVPRESMLRAALEEKPLLMEMAFQRRIILASPLVLMPILKVVAYGWDQAQISQKAAEIQELGKDLHKRAALFLTRFVDVGKKLESLTASYEDADKSLRGRQGMMGQLRKIEEYGCKSEKDIPKNLISLDADEENELTLDLDALVLETSLT
jgi:DNA recombination protein RmuC